MFEYTSSDGRIHVYETYSAFYVMNMSTGESACMGDGVDLFPGVPVSSKRFNTCLRRDIDANTADYIEAYFPDSTI